MTKLAGKVALVTGAARGMGLSHARKMASEGAKVVMTDIREDLGRSAAAEIDGDVRFVLHDVAKAADWDRVIAATEAAFGHLNVLVNNAGITALRSLEDSTEADYRAVIDVNQLSVWLGMKAGSVSIRRAGGGSIINVSSTLGVVGGANLIAYTASKFAVRGMSKGAAAELGCYNIRVNSIHPGGIVTEMTKASGGAMDAVFAAIPIARRGDPIEVSNVVSFLASDDSSYITGAEIIIDGGWTCQW
jgi:3alpha(or 20beta)-hydroxysteroid dehydrogenase